jgi:hypothetical protein
VACGSALVGGTVVSAPNFQQASLGVGVVRGSSSTADVDFGSSFNTLPFANQQICSLTCIVRCPLSLLLLLLPLRLTPCLMRARAHAHITEAAVTWSGAVSFNFEGPNNMNCLNATVGSTDTSFRFTNFPANFSGALATNILVGLSALTHTHTHTPLSALRCV